MAGRRPKPTAIKLLEGNPGKRELNKYEPKPDKKLPVCPDWLEPEAKNEWRRLAKVMGDMGILTDIDQKAFATYCQCYARWRNAEEFLSQHGTVFKTPSGYIQQLPQVRIAHDYGKQMMRIASEFGLTPASRSRIIAGEIMGPRDEMDELLGD